MVLNKFCLDKKKKKHKHGVTAYFRKFYSIKVKLVYNVVLIPAVQKSDSVIHLYALFFILFSITVSHRTVNVVPCAMQWAVVV